MQLFLIMRHFLNGKNRIKFRLQKKNKKMQLGSVKQIYQSLWLFQVATLTSFR